MVTDPSKGFKLYKAWGEFPSDDIPVRQIKLKVRFTCPDGMRCADWDYKDHITIRRKGGVDGPSQDYEIGRMLTPYGGGFSRDWSFNWEVDITDFSALLRDSVEIEYNHTGYEPNTDRGWGVTLDFEIIRGRPAWEPVSIQKIYDGAFKYGDSTDNIEKSLKPVSFSTADQADFARLRVVQTGHGMDRPDNCAEFCNKYREFWYDGTLMDHKSIWKLCGDNPLYPQAGTWVYDRANWCPGDLMQPDIYDLEVHPGKKHTIDLNMQNYVSSDASAVEVISAYLIQYKKAASANDVRIDDIINPSLKDAHRRYNPSVMNPRIIVKNMGGRPLTALTVKYGTKGFGKNTFIWKGNLKPAASAEIVLPGAIESKPGKNEFEVELLKPNGSKDGFVADNKAVSAFSAAPRHHGDLILYLRTNKQAGQNGYSLKDARGKIVRERAVGTINAESTYQDTLKLPAGKYQLKLVDTAGNGLEFWANPRGGYGKARVLNTNGAMLRDFESDFGSLVQYEFEVADPGAPVDPIRPLISCSLFPTRTNDKTTLEYYANFEEDVLVEIVTDPGDELVEVYKYPKLKAGSFTYDLSRLPKGRYYLKVKVNGNEKFKKRIRLKE
jgi:hypothetical protein